MKFRVLLCGHDPDDPAEATLVLAAAAALNGLSADGTAMQGAQSEHFPTLAELTAEVVLPIGAVRRGVHHLEKVGDIRIEYGVVAVHSEALSKRWARPRQRIRITEEARKLGMRAKPLLLTALVAGQKDKCGHLMLGVEFLAERTGFTHRTVERTLQAARAADAIHTWSRFTHSSGFRQQLWIALGPSRNGGSDASRSGGSAGDQLAHPAAQSPEPAVGAVQSGGHPIAKRRSPHRETAVTPSQSGGRHPDLHPEYLPDHHPDRAAPRDRTIGDTATEPFKAPAAPKHQPPPAPGPATSAPPAPNQQRQIVEAWVTAFVTRGIERMEQRHAADVAGLLDKLGPPPAEAVRSRRVALHADRLALARRVIVWCPSPERLGRWLVRVSRRFGVQNLGAYLRRATEKGDPGTVLNRGRRAGNDFTPQTERQLEGAYADDVARIVVGGTSVLQSTDEVERVNLRQQLRELLAADRRVDARTVLLQLVGCDRSDIAIAKAIGDVCTLASAKELLAA